MSAVNGSQPNLYLVHTILGSIKIYWQKMANELFVHTSTRYRSFCSDDLHYYRSTYTRECIQVVVTFLGTMCTEVACMYCTLELKHTNSVFWGTSETDKFQLSHISTYVRRILMKLRKWDVHMCHYTCIPQNSTTTCIVDWTYGLRRLTSV